MAYWLCQLFGWGLIAFGQTLTAVASEVQASTLRIAIEVSFVNVLAVVYTHLLRGYMKRNRWQTLGIARLLPRIFGASLVFGFPIALLMRFMSIATMWGGGTPELQQEVADVAGDFGAWLVYADPLFLRTLNWTVTIAAWIVVYFSITSLRDRRLVELRQSELARALQVAELRLLKSQFNPHFLFNCLNSVRALIADDTARRAEGRDAAGADTAIHADSGTGGSRHAGARAGNRCRLPGARIAATRRAVAHRARHRRRSQRYAHSSDAAADSGRECNQARDRRAAAGRHIADQRHDARARADH